MHNTVLNFLFSFVSVIFPNIFQCHTIIFRENLEHQNKKLKSDNNSEISNEDKQLNKSNEETKENIPEDELSSAYEMCLKDKRYENSCFYDTCYQNLKINLQIQHIGNILKSVVYVKYSLQNQWYQYINASNSTQSSRRYVLCQITSPY